MKLFFILPVFPIIILELISKVQSYQYISTERPEVTYYNPKYVSFMNATSRRYGRKDPFYYFELHLHLLRPWGKNVSMDFYFDEWLTYVYRRGLVEMHFNLCDLINKDNFFGTALRQGKLAKQQCPYPSGAYHLYNMTIPAQYLPPNFPFRKGRIHLNVTATDENEFIAHMHVDMEIKEYNPRKKKIN